MQRQPYHTIPYHPNMPTNLYATAPNRWSGLKSHFFFTMWPHVNTTVATFFVNIGIKMSSLTHFHGVFFLINGKAFYRFVEKLVEMNVDIMWRYQSIFQLGVSFWHVACLIWLLEISLPIWPDLVSQLDRVGFPFSEWLSQSTQRLLHIDSVDMQFCCSTLQMIISCVLT